jgi:hypothetical protein
MEEFFGPGTVRGSSFVAIDLLIPISLRKRLKLSRIGMRSPKALVI